jgi:hypothetical protein
VSFPISLARSDPDQRLRDLGLFSGLVLWLVYTRVFWAANALHLTLPPCPFYYLTGHPCPFCGGTRSFAYMWQGDFADAVRLYPLGPALFAGALLGVGGLGASLITGRAWLLRITARQWRLITIGAVSAVAVSWALKVFIIGN